MAPTIQYGKYGSILTLDFLGKRWGWEKTKVWRFFQNHSCTFGLYRMPGAYGSLIFNLSYYGVDRDNMPSEEKIILLLNEVRQVSKKGIVAASDCERLNRIIAWNSMVVIKSLEEQNTMTVQNDRVALRRSNTRVYFSHGRNCKHRWNWIYDCLGSYLEKRMFDYSGGVGILCPFQVSGTDPPQVKCS